MLAAGVAGHAPRCPATRRSRHGAIRFRARAMAPGALRQRIVFRLVDVPDGLNRAARVVSPDDLLVDAAAEPVSADGFGTLRHPEMKAAAQIHARAGDSDAHREMSRPVANQDGPIVDHRPAVDPVGLEAIVIMQFVTRLGARMLGIRTTGETDAGQQHVQASFQGSPREPGRCAGAWIDAGCLVSCNVRLGAPIGCERRSCGICRFGH